MPLINTLRLMWLALLLAAGFYIFSGLTIESNILKLLPKYESEQTNEVISNVTKNINSKIILMAKAPKDAAVETPFTQAMNVLESSGFFKKVLYQVDVEKAINVYQLLWPNRTHLLSREDLVAKDMGTWGQMATQLAKEQLFGLSAINGDQLRQDPLFLFQRHLNQLSQFSAFEFDTSSGFFTVQTKYHQHWIAFLELNNSAYSPQTQEQVDALLTSLENSQETSADLNWLSFGTVRYANHAYQQAKHEISTVGLGSLLGISLLFLFAFRSLSPLLLSLTAIGLGLLVALALTTWVFGHVHVFSLVFGATIAGVSIDYCFHYLIESQHQQKVCLKTLSKPLLLGFGSSAMVYLGFTITGYQVLAQISVFSVTGLLAVLVQVMLFFPLLIKQSAQPAPAVIVKLTNAIYDNPLARFCSNSYRLMALFVFTAVLLAFTYAPNDDVRALQSLSPLLKNQETEIKQVLSWQESDAYLLFQSAKIDQLLSDEAYALASIRTQGNETFGVSDFIPSRAQQSQNLALQKQLYNNPDVENYLSEVGLEQPQLLTGQNIQSSLKNPALSEILSQRLMGQINGLWTLVLPISTAIDLSSMPDVLLIQQAEDTSHLFGLFRTKSTWMLAVTIMLLLLVLTLIKYRFTTAFSVVVIPVLAGLMALLLSQTLGFHVSLFSILGQLLVLGMGIDYVVFLKESAHPKVIMRALLLSATTTILAFGLLTLSQVAVIKSFGFTVGIGIILVLLMSPSVAKRRNNNDKTI